MPFAALAPASSTGNNPTGDSHGGALAFFFDLPQDVAVLLPLLRLAQQGGQPVQVWYTTRLARRWPEAFGQLEALGLPRRAFSHRAIRWGWVGQLPLVTLITASESSAPSHDIAHRLAKAVNARGGRTVTLQHGFENVGLTYRDSEAAAPITFASQLVLAWGDRLPDWVPDETRAKAIPVGRTLPAIAAMDMQQKLAATLREKSGGKPIVLVADNLHWDRYDADYRRAFFVQLEATARAFPYLAFLLSTHPGSLPARRARTPQSLLALPNVARLQDWVDKAASLPNGAVPTLVQAVITTPSTVALDAAQLQKPVAVFAGTIDLPAYAPLPLLRDQADWADFLKHPPLDLDTAFTARMLHPGDGAAAALSAILQK